MLISRSARRGRCRARQLRVHGSGAAHDVETRDFRSGINETQAGRLPVRDLGPASPRPGPCFCRLRKTLALKKWLIGRGGGRQHFVGKTPRVGVVCTPSSPAAAPDEEAATATATVQALSPQKRQWRRVLSAAADRR